MKSVTTLGITFDTHFNVTAQIVNIIRTAIYTTLERREIN